MLNKIILVLALLATPAYSESPFEQCKRQKSQCIQKLEELIKSNDKLIEELRNIKAQTPKIQLESLELTVDQDFRIFTKDKIKGSIQIGTLSYDLIAKLKLTIVKIPKPELGLRLRPKAYALSSYELDSDDKIRQHNSAALGLDLFYYKYVNINLLLGYRMYGPAIGVDITDHFGLIGGIGIKYNDDKALFIGAGFDF